jgi:hypothetical protein
LKKNGWWDILGMDGFLEFPRYKSFGKIIGVEYDRWRFSDDESVKKLEKIMK